MSNVELRYLLEAQPLGLLDDSEVERVEEALAGSASLRAESEALGAAYATWSESVEADLAQAQSEDLRGRVLAAISQGGVETAPPLGGKGLKLLKGAAKAEGSARPGPNAADLGVRVHLNCIYCHAETERDEVLFCAGCLAPHHAECFVAHGRCSAPGCEETRSVRPSEPQAPAGPEAPRRGRRFLIPWVAGLLTLGGVAALIDPGPEGRVAVPTAGARAPSPVPAATPPTPLVSFVRADLDLVDVDLDKVPLREAFASLEPLLPRPRPGVDLSAQRAMAIRLPLKELDSLPSEDLVSLRLRQVPRRFAYEVLARQTGCRIQVEADGQVVVTRVPRVTIQFTDTSSNGVVKLLASYAGKRIQILPGVKGQLTLDCKDLEWDQALLGLAACTGNQIWEGGEGLVFAPADARLPEGAHPLQLPRLLRAEPWPRLSFDQEGPRVLNSPRVTLGAGPRLAGDLVAELAQRTRIPIWPGDQACSEERIEVNVTDLPWSEALRRVAARLGARVQVHPTGALVLVQIPKVTIEFHDASVRTVLQLLAAYAGKNVMLSERVLGNLTLDVHEVDWDLALGAISRTMGLKAWAVDEDPELALITGLGEELPGATRHRLPELWKGIPPADAKVSLNSASLNEACLQLTKKTGAALRSTVPEGLETEFKVKDQPWRVALRQLARSAGCWIEDTPTGAWLRPKEAVTLRAYDAPLPSWLRLLASLDGINLLLAPEVQGPVRVSLDGVAYLDALEGSVISAGYALHRERQRFVRVGEGQRPPGQQVIPSRDWIELELKSKRRLKFPPLQATAVTPSRRVAVLGGQWYSEGDYLRDFTTEDEILDLRVLRVESAWVEIGVRGGASVRLGVRLLPEARYAPTVLEGEGTAQRKTLDSARRTLTLFLAEAGSSASPGGEVPGWALSGLGARFGVSSERDGAAALRSWLTSARNAVPVLEGDTVRWPTEGPDLVMTWKGSRWEVEPPAEK